MPLTKVSSGVIAANAVVDSFGTQSITGDKLGLTAINANNIVDATITGAKLTSATITGDKIGVGQITSNLFAAGAVSTSNISSGNSNVSVTSANGNVTIGTAGSERMRITSAGDVGIGTTSPTDKLTIAHADEKGITFKSTGTDGTAAAQLFFEDTNGGTGGVLRFDHDVNSFTFATAGTTERMRIDSSGNLLFNSGYGSVATAYGCRAWVNFDGTGTPAIRASGNVTSITDNGTGVFTVNFTNTLPDANYSVSLTGRYSGSNTDGRYVLGIDNMNAGSCKVVCLNVSDTVLLDPLIYCCAFFR